MSAIFGIINKKGEPVEKHFIDKMLQAISHRTTDGYAARIDKNVGMGNCILVSYQQQNFENQPLKTGHLTITSDARIDNRNELASYFNIDKHQLNATPDSMLILLSYEKWGRHCIDYLEGDFAFAIWDDKEQQLFVATDPVGFRPFFYYDSPDAFIFCSEIKGIVAVKTTPNYFNEDSLNAYFYSQGVPDQTYNKDIFALCGGNTLVLQDGNISIEKYWNLESSGKYHFTKDDDWYDCLRDLLYKSVRKKINFDVPIGITLSGGLDSTSIACILSKLLMEKNKPLFAFSSVLPINHKNTENDERNYIELVGKHCKNIIQTYVEAPGVGSFSNLKDSFKIEEFFPSSTFYMNRALLEEAKRKNVRTLFSGFGGDYWVSWNGDSAIYELIQQGCYKDAAKAIFQFSRTEEQSVIHIFRKMYASHTNWYKNLKNTLEGEKINTPSQTILHEDFLKNHPVKKENNISHKLLMQALINNGYIGRMAGRFYNQDSTYQMETAIPLFDKNIFELLSDLPLHLFVNGGHKRSLIRNVMNGINPPEINARKDKLPFSPECVKRIYNDRDMMKQLTHSLPHNFVFDKYINKKIINNYIEKMPSTYTKTSNDIIALRIAQFGIVTILLKKLKDNDYIFI